MPNIGRKGQCPWRGKGDALHPPLLLPAMHTAHFEPACVSAKATVSRMRPRQCASWNGKLQMEKHNQMFGVLGRVLLRRGVGLSAQSFFFSAYRAETVFNICQMSRPTVKTTNGRGSCQGQPAKCRTKSPGRHSWADQSLEAGGTNAFRWAWHRFEVGPVDSDRSMRLYLHLHHITVYTVYIYMCVCA
jgi:hypothetical protein